MLLPLGLNRNNSVLETFNNILFEFFKYFIGIIFRSILGKYVYYYAMGIY